MLDKNGVEIKTGMIVEVTGAYFKNDNGLYFVTNSAGDPSWSGSDHCLHKIGKTGKVSTAKYNTAFWPLSVFVNNRVKAAEAREWNAEHAQIEVKTIQNMAGVIAYFEKKAEEADDEARRVAWNWGEDSETVKKFRKIAIHYRAVVAGIENQPEQEPEDQNTQEPESQNTQEPESQNDGKKEEATTAPKYYPIDEKMARAAHEMASMSDYPTDRATKEYRASVDAAADLVNSRKGCTSTYYHSKLDALLDLYSRRLADWTNAYNRNGASCPSVLVSGASNFPTRKKAKQNAREDKLWAEYQEIKSILDKIKSVGTGPVDLADPHAREILTDKLQRLQKGLEERKALNAYYRKHKSFIGFPGLSREEAAGMSAKFEEAREKCPWIDKPFPSYELSSLRGKIKRTQARLAELDKLEAQKENPGQAEEHDGFQIVRNAELNRLQILFDEKPDDETRETLKQNGFRWSPKNGAWQRQLTQNAERAARVALGLN